jgi:pyrroline-5-carboxylate reductase
MTQTKISIIGAGNMANSMLEGILRNKLIAPQHIMVTNRSVGKLERMSQHWPVNVSYDNLAATKFGNIVVLSVKPVDMKVACEQLSQGMDSSKLIISVAAGIHIDTLKKWLKRPHQPIIRVMPNLPSQIGHGMSGWSASSEVNAHQLAIAQQILGVLGGELRFRDENLLDQVTAISGSGPAYIFYLAELLTESGKAIGLKDDEAKELVLQTIYGAANMLRANGKTPAELRIAVTSKGGTTEAALREFMQSNLDTVITRGVEAAYKRGKEIGQQWANG